MLDKPLTVRVCSCCGKDVPIYHRKGLEYPDVWCSKKCLGEWRRKQNENCKCFVCGRMFHLKPSLLNKTDKHTCSRKCMGELRKTIYKNKNNPNYMNRGKLNPCFKGNVCEHAKYLWEYAPDHPFAIKGAGYRVRKHRLIAEQYLLTEENSVEINGKRYLKPEYIVHHIDENKFNNDLSNLVVMTRSQHSKLHQELKQQREDKKMNEKQYYDNHYAEMLVQPIEVMQELLTPQEFVGALMFNINKYDSRAGHKAGEAINKDEAKRDRYLAWLYQLRDEYVKIDPKRDYECPKWFKEKVLSALHEKRTEMENERKR